MLAISWPDSLHGLLPFFFWPHRVQLPESVSATPVLPFPPLRALPHDESNLCGESRYTAFGEFSIGRNTCARRCLKLHSAFGSHSRGRQFLCLYFSRWNETTNNAKRGIPFSPWRSMLECDLKVDEYETKWFVGKINGEYLRSVSFFFV